MLSCPQEPPSRHAKRQNRSINNDFTGIHHFYHTNKCYTRLDTDTETISVLFVLGGLESYHMSFYGYILIQKLNGSYSLLPKRLKLEVPREAYHTTIHTF